MSRSRVHAIINTRKQIVPPFDFRQPVLVNVVLFELFVNMVEIEDVNASALVGIFDHRTGLHDECPIA